MKVKIKFKKRLAEFFNRVLARNLILILFLFIILIFFSILSESTDANISEASWWNISWGKRMIISFNGTINQNWTQEFFFNKPSSMDENCNDIRWLNSAQTSELGHRNVVCNSSTVIEHVFLNDNGTIYFYYNNSDAVTTSKWRNAYQCGDDFEDNLFPNISAVNIPTLSVANGILNTIHSGGPPTVGWICANSINYQNYTYYIAGKSTQNGFGQYFRWQQDGNIVSLKSYTIDRNAASGMIHFYPLGTAFTYGSSTDTWYNQTTIVNGSNYSLSINKVFAISFLDTSYMAENSAVGVYLSLDSGKGSTDWYYVMPTMNIMPVVNYREDHGITPSITYPENKIYATNVSDLNYTISSEMKECWYSLDQGQTNTTIDCGENATGLISREGENIWTIFGGNSIDFGSDTVTFFKDTIYPQMEYTDIHVANSSILVSFSIIEDNFANMTINLFRMFDPENSYDECELPCNINSSVYYEPPISFVEFSGLEDGIYTLNTTVTDIANNMNWGTSGFKIDTIPPQLNIFEPRNITYTTSNLSFIVNLNEPGSCFYSFDEGATNFEMESDTSRTQFTEAPMLEDGHYTLEISCEDEAGNTDKKTISFTKDANPPNITCPPDIFLECSTPAGQIVDTGSATAVDIVDPFPMIKNNAPFFFPVGITKFAWKATDASNHSATCEQTVNLQDTTPPALSCIDVVNFMQGDAVILPQPSFSDVCSAVTLSNNQPKILPVGVTPVTWKARDTAGNTAQCVTVVNVTSKEPLFKRGDSNGNGKVDISDPINTLNFLFLGTGKLECKDAVDANDDNKTDISDAVYTLNFLFSNGGIIKPPYPDQGVDPTPDALTCAFYNTSNPGEGGGASVQSVKEALNETKKNQTINNQTKFFIISYLEAIPKGSLSISTSPTGASIYLDGLYKGLTPRNMTNMTSGNYTLKIVKSGYKDYSAIVNIKSGKVTAVAVTLQSSFTPIYSPFPSPSPR